MKIKQVFPAIYAGPYRQEVESIWEQEYDIENSSLVFLLEMLFNEECALALELTLDEFRTRVNLIFDGVIAARNNPATVIQNDGLDLLLLIHGSQAAGVFNQRGAFLDNHDCFMKSLYGKTTENGEEYDLEPIRLWRFANPHIGRAYPGINVAQVITRWLGELYYYCRSFSGLLDWCLAFLQPAISWSSAVRATTAEGAQLATQLHSWAIAYNKQDTATQLDESIKSSYSELSWSKHSASKQSLGIHLVVTSQDPILRRAIYTELVGHSGVAPSYKMQLACGLNRDIDSIKTGFVDILSAVREYSQDAEARSSDHINLTYEKSRLFKILDPVILTLCQHGATKELAALLTAFYHWDADWVLEDSILFILPNAPEGVLFCAREQVAIHEQDTAVAVPALVDIANRALSQLLVLRGTVNQNTPIPERMVGMPIMALGNEFEKEVTGFYNFAKLRELDISSITSLCPFNFNQLPLQALTLKELQITFPIHTSLQKKSTYPAIRSVLLWQGNSNTSEFECNALGSIFYQAGVQVTTMVHGMASKQDFVEAYKSTKYDVIWVSSHGHREYYEADNSSFSLSHTETVSVSELAAIPIQQTEMRLLFLNVCEGGANTQIGEFRNVGFGHMLTSSNQDVLSHLWMTDSYVAALLGVLVGVGLCQPNISYFSAYLFAMRTLLTGREHSINQLAKLTLGTPQPAITELIDRLENYSYLELNNILKWGSAVYFT